MRISKALMLNLTLSLAMAAGASPALAQKSKAKGKTKTNVEASKKTPTEFISTTVATTPTPDASLPPATNQMPAETLSDSTLSTQPSTPVVTPTPIEEPTRSEISSSSHLFGLHAALGAPHPVSVGLNYVHPAKYFSAELNFGAFSVKSDDVEVKLGNTEVGLRYHPWAGSFYLGALLGTQSLSGEKTEIVNTTEKVTAKVDVKSTYVSPHIGWLWGNDGGFFFSMDVGYQAPMSSSVDFSSNASALAQATPDYQKLDKDVRDAGKTLGEMGLPLITLIKVGWLF